MRILIVGGIAESLVIFRGPLLKALVARNHEVVACAPDASHEIRWELDKIGVRYRHVPLARAGLSPVGDWQTLMALKEIIKQEKPERVLAYTVKPVIYTHLAGRLAGNPAVYGMITGLGYSFGNGSYRQRIVGSVVRNLYRTALRHSSGIFFQNPDDRNVFRNLGLLPRHIPVTMINGSGVDLAWYTPQPLPDGPVFLLVARLIVEKGVREYYQAACQLKEKYPQARFQVAGGVDLNPGSIRQDELQRWQAEGVIEYLGWLDDIRPAYAGASVFVLPSYHEGIPRTILEAMSMGRPVITTDAPGCRETILLSAGGKGERDRGEEVIRGENGFLVRVRDIDALAKAMQNILETPGLATQMAKRSREIAAEKFDVDKVNAVILNAMGLV